MTLYSSIMILYGSPGFVLWSSTAPLWASMAPGSCTVILYGSIMCLHGSPGVALWSSTVPLCASMAPQELHCDPLRFHYVPPWLPRSCTVILYGSITSLHGSSLRSFAATSFSLWCGSASSFDFDPEAAFYSYTGPAFPNDEDPDGSSTRLKMPEQSSVPVPTWQRVECLPR